MTGHRALPDHPWVAWIRDVPRVPALAVGGALAALLAVVAFVSCGGSDGRPSVAAPPPTFFTAPPPRPSNPVPVSPTAPLVTDGCRGLLSAGQATQAAGFPVTGTGTVAAAAITGYTDAVRAKGLQASTRLCPFAGQHGDQVYVLSMVFADAGQAATMYTSSRSGAGTLPGVGDEAATDRMSTLVARRGRAVVLVLLIRPTEPAADHTAPLRALATAALARS